MVAIVDAGLEAVRGMDAPPRVLEIGPGLGVLTEELLNRGCRVTAVEKDPVLAGRLAEALGRPAGLEVVAADALDFIAAGSADDMFDCMVSTLPYQAGTRILLELVQRRAVAAATALVQTEVAMRIAATEGSRTRSLAGVRVQLDYDVEIVRKVAPSCFWPRPEVASSVIRLVRHDRNVGLSEKERAVFRSLTKAAFGQRRKQLGSIFKDLVKSTARAEELANDEWINLAKGLAEQNEDT